MSIKTSVALLKMMVDTGHELNDAMDHAMKAVSRFGGAVRRTRILAKNPWTPTPGPRRHRAYNRPKVAKRHRRAGHWARRKRHAQA
jgi:hypothetical protein